MPSKNSSGGSLGIGIDPNDATVTLPSLIKERSEWNKEYRCRDSPKREKSRKDCIYMKTPENFPMRNFVNYLEERNEEGQRILQEYKRKPKPCFTMIAKGLIHARFTRTEKKKLVKSTRETHKLC